MLYITIPSNELWDETNQRFIDTKEQKIQLEHSLVSLSKWESKWCKPFINTEKTQEELLDYIKCMTITQNVDPNIYISMSTKIINEIMAYVNAKMTATWIREETNKRGVTKPITSELIYYWMISHNIPFSCEKWHLNRLLMLIKVCSAETQAANGKPKIPTGKALSQRSALNAARRKQFNTRG